MSSGPDAIRKERRDRRERQLKAEATAAAYRHCAEMAQDEANGDAAHYKVLSALADTFEAAAQKAEQP